MARVKGPADLTHLIKLYRAGKTPKEIGEQVGVAGGTVRTWMKDAGVQVRGPSEAQRIEIPDAGRLVERYVAGESVKQLAQAVGVSRSTFTRILQEAGVKLRGSAESQPLWIHRRLGQDPGFGRRITQAAHRAKRGRPNPREARERAAQTRYRKQLHIGKYEREIANALRAHGLVAELQYPVSTYNLDVALPEPRVAVEVFGRPLLGRNRTRFPERSEYILDAGWCMAFVRCGYDSDRVCIGAIAHQLATLVEIARGRPAGRGEYWVVRSDGQLLPTDGLDLIDVARVLGPKPARE